MLISIGLSAFAVIAAMPAAQACSMTPAGYGAALIEAVNRAAYDRLHAGQLDQWRVWSVRDLVGDSYFEIEAHDANGPDCLVWMARASMPGSTCRVQVDFLEGRRDCARRSTD